MKTGELARLPTCRMTAAQTPNPKTGNDMLDFNAMTEKEHSKQVAELAILLALTAKSPKLRKQRAAVGAHLAELMQKPHDR